MVFQRFYVAEDVIPTAAVQPDDMVAQVIEDLVHLEDRRQGFDQYRGFDGAARQIKTILGKAEDFAPPGRFLPGLGFRQIEVRAAAFFQQLAVVVEEIQREIKQATGDRLTLPLHVFLRQMQATHTGDQDRRIRLQLINFSGFVGIGDGAIHRIMQVDLPLDHFVPARRQRVFEISHKHLHVGVQGIDHHLAFNRPGDFHPTIAQIIRNTANFPLTFTNGISFRNKIRKIALIDLLLPAGARSQ
ncbi:hypothetical protein D3C79_589650 [compost metagenome]